MELITKKALADKIGKDLAHISMALRRNSIAENSDGKIDIENPLNKAWLIKQIAKANKNQPAAKAPAVKKDKAPVPVQQSAPVATEDGPKPRKPVFRNNYNKEANELSDIQTEKERISLENARLTLEGNKLRMEQRMGKIVPVDQMQLLIITFSKCIMTEYEAALKMVVDNMVSEYGLAAEDVVKIRKQVLDSVNVANKNTVESTEKRLKEVAEEYKLARGVGERN